MIVERGGTPLAFAGDTCANLPSYGSPVPIVVELLRAGYAVARSTVLAASTCLRIASLFTHGKSMAMKMFSPMYLAILVIFVVYSQTDALQRKEIVPRRCFQCQGATCEGSAPLTATCPTERPFCATVASAPNYTSSLTCATSDGDPCSLKPNPQQTLEMTCVCSSHLCNAPFSRDLQNELITFASTDILKNRTEYIEMFWKQSHIIDDDDSHVYKLITMKTFEITASPIRNSTDGSEMGATESISSDTQRGQVLAEYGGVASEPRAEQLKQEATAPSDDEEDEGEGSGADESGLSSRRPPAAPAAPSSFLPADDSAAHQSYLAFLATLPAFYILL